MLKKKHIIIGSILASLSVSGAAFAYASQQTGVNSNKSMNMSMSKSKQQNILSDKQIHQQEQMSNDYLAEKEMTPKILKDGTKEFTLNASVFPWELYPGQITNVWGYNQQVPGPLIRVKVGDRVSIVVHNSLPEPTTVHWHGLAVPNSMDGVPFMGINGMKMGSQEAIPKNGSFTYLFTVTPQMIGTHYYHSHVNDDYQVDMGLHGVFIVDPAEEQTQKYDVDALYEIGSFKIKGSDSENVFTLNGKAAPETPILNVKQNQMVRIRLVNASAEEFHVMHLHGYTFSIIALDGNPVSNPQEANTINLGPSQTADIAFKATNLGQWMFHCHVLDHTINPSLEDKKSDQQMEDMGGLMTFINVK